MTRRHLRLCLALACAHPLPLLAGDGGTSWLRGRAAPGVATLFEDGCPPLEPMAGYEEVRAQQVHVDLQAPTPDPSPWGPGYPRPDPALARSARLMGFMLASGTILAQDCDRASTWFQAGLQAADPISAYNLAALHARRPLGSLQARRALVWAARQGYPPAMDQLAMLHRRDHSSSFSRGKAEEWFQKAAGAGYAPSQFELGMLWLEQDRTRAAGLRQLRAAASQGHLVALAQLLQQGYIERETEADQRQLDAQLARPLSALLEVYRGWLRGGALPGAAFVFDYADDVAWYRQQVEDMRAERGVLQAEP